MKRFKNILVSADTRLDHHPLVDAAMDMAVHNDAALTIVDVVPEFSWAARMTLPDHKHVRELVVQEKQEKLDMLAKLPRDKGIAVETKLLEGKTSVEIIREVLRRKHDLVMSVTRGRDSRHPGFFGHTARRLLRNCPSPIWLVAPDAAGEVKHVVACVDTSTNDPLDAELNDKIYELASSISNYHTCQFSVVHAWQMPDESLLGARLKPEIVAEYAQQHRKHREQLLETFLQRYDSSCKDDNVYMVKGTAPEAIASFVRDQSVDLVVMGTVARSGLSGMLIGNTSERILDRIECSVLALKPYRFESPIRE